MKTILVRVLSILFLLTSATFATAGDFVSVVLSSSTTSSMTIDVPSNRFLIIRNFTQVGGSTRGDVIATLLSGVNPAVTILDAVLVDPTTPPEVINNVVVGGPASVLVECPDMAATCFITYRKGSD